MGGYTIRRLTRREVTALRHDASWELTAAVDYNDKLMGVFEGGELLAYAIVGDHEGMFWVPKGAALLPVLEVSKAARRRGLGDLLVSALKARYKVILATCILTTAQPFWAAEQFEDVYEDKDGYRDGLWTTAGFNNVGRAFAASYRDM
jgi:GNAT superfamily N-acetyltransferase